MKRFTVQSIFQVLTILPLIAQATASFQQPDDTRHLRTLQEEATLSPEEADHTKEQTKVAIVVSLTCVVLAGLIVFARLFIFVPQDADDETSTKVPPKLEPARSEKCQSERVHKDDGTKRVRFAEP